MSNYAKLAANSTATANPSKKRVVGRPFPKGVSGNPLGRPKSKPITDMLRPIFDDPECVEAIRQNVKSTLTGKGMAGVILLSHIADRLEGKMPDEVTINDNRNLSDDEIEAKLEALRAARS